MAIKRNVQQQNAVAREEIMRHAMAFRDPLAYPWLRAELQNRGLDPSAGVLADLKSTPEQNGEFVAGTWLASGPRFFRFTALISAHPTVSIEIETWEDITDAREIDAHCPGTGKSFGWLAVEVFREITGAANNAIDATCEGDGER
jgi:hypothetical protein